MSQMLLGRAAGLEATLTSPQPGGAVDLSIRGAGTPIFIVDGVMMPSTSLERLKRKPGYAQLYQSFGISRT